MTEEEEEQYRVYKKFFSVEEAEPILELLTQRGIDYRTNHYNSNIGSTFASTNNPNQLELRLLPNQFEMVDNMLEQEAEKAIGMVPPDYYLLTFTDAELMEVLEKPDEWTKEDYVLSQHLLKQRGKPVSEETLHQLYFNRMEALREPEKGSTAANIFGYISALSGGVIGILMGWYMMSLKKTLPNGESVNAYDLATRSSGKQIFYIGIISFIAWFVLLMIHFAG